MFYAACISVLNVGRHNSPTLVDPYEERGQTDYNLFVWHIKFKSEFAGPFYF